ncbi:MAG: hypothetical protein ACI8RZ_004064 [Myxococcota bacterium]|jgi:hypothetical protein
MLPSPPLWSRPLPTILGPTAAPSKATLAFEYYDINRFNVALIATAGEAVISFRTIPGDDVLSRTTEVVSKFALIGGIAYFVLWACASDPR